MQNGSNGSNVGYDEGVFGDTSLELGDNRFAFLDDMNLKPSQIMSATTIYGNYIQKMSLENLMRVTVKVLDKDVKEGGEKVDAKGNVSMKNNVVERWPDKHFITIAYSGVEVKQEVKPSIYSMVDIGCSYYAVGRFGQVNKYSDYMGLIIEDLFEIQDLAISKLEKHFRSLSTPAPTPKAKKSN